MTGIEKCPPKVKIEGEKRDYVRRDLSNNNSMQDISLSPLLRRTGVLTNRHVMGCERKRQSLCKQK